MRTRIAAVLLAAAALPAAAQSRPAAPAAGAAQAMPARAVLLEDVERSRQNVLKYVDAAPDSVLTFRIVPGVRSYAEQIEHAAGANAFIMAQALKLRAARPAGDSAVYRRDKAALRAYVNASYDVFAGMVRDATEAQMTGEGSFAGQTRTGWRWVLASLEHTTWTLGQTVPYLRAKGVTPPQYLPF